MKKLLGLLIFCIFSSWAQAQNLPKRIYYVDITGDKPLKAAILAKLKTKPCFSLEDIEKGAKSSECYAFVASLKTTKLTDPDSYRLKVKIKKPKKLKQPKLMSVQGFKFNGKRVERYFDAGTFSIPSQQQIDAGEANYSDAYFVEKATDTILGLGFK